MCKRITIPQIWCHEIIPQISGFPLILQPRPQGLLGVQNGGVEKNPGEEQVTCLQKYWRFDCFKMAAGLRLANLWSRDVLFARVFSKPPFQTPRRPWGRGCVTSFSSQNKCKLISENFKMCYIKVTHQSCFLQVDLFSQSST